MWAWTIVFSRVPFFLIPNSILKDIEKILELRNDSVLYNLGCGDGGTLFYLSKNNPKAKYIGIEGNTFPYFLLRMKLLYSKKFSKSKLEIINKNFSNCDLSEATHVLMYLYPNIMDDLLPKLENELKQGTRLVSVSFKFTGKKPIFEIDLNRSKYKLARKIYVYEF